MLGKTKNKFGYVLFAIMVAVSFFTAFSFSRAQETPNGQTQAENTGRNQGDGQSTTFNPANPNLPGNVSTVQHTTKEERENLFSSEISSSILTPVKWILYMVFILVGWTVSIGATIMDWMLSPLLWGQNGFLEKTIIYDTWQIFRDLFNMFFILILLFSAFATIFQVDKYSIKKIWLSVLLAALLINFSYPIARIIIDISNITMFSFLDGTSGLQMSANLMDKTKIEAALLPNGYANYPIPYLIASIIFIFILGVTLCVLGFMLMIRLLALMIIIIVSPVGFAGSIFPGMGSYSSKWWDALFKYSFFGPIMVFVMMLANSIMAGVGNDATKEFLDSARSNSPASNGMGEGFAEWLAHAAFFMMPVVIMWMGMGIARSMSIVGAGTVVGQGEKFSKWMGKNAGGGRQLLRMSGVSGGAEARWKDFKKTGFNGKLNRLYGGSEAQDLREAKWKGAFKKGRDGWDDAQNEHNRKKVAEMRKEWKDKGGAEDAELQKLLKDGSDHEKMAAALEMAENNGFGKGPEAVERYEQSLLHLKNQPIYKKIFEDKVKEKHIKMKIESEIKSNPGKPRQDIYNDNLKGMSMDKISKQKSGIHEDAELHQYIQNTITEAAAKSKKAGAAAASSVVRAADNLSGVDRKLWRDRGGISV